MHRPSPRPGTLWISLYQLSRGAHSTHPSLFYCQPLSHREAQMSARLKKEKKVSSSSASFTITGPFSPLPLPSPLCSHSSGFYPPAPLELPCKVTRDLWMAGLVVRSADFSLNSAGVCTLYFLASPLHSSCASQSSLSSPLWRNNGIPWLQICSPLSTVLPW